ncbi:PucR family transcriptional regulator [Kineococcus terrestris]|uniref:PucR family transcriptional regulator n=1 Tax=Kineococcus terrestris TaxID=2044856 RepID=UPI0034DB252F
MPADEPDAEPTGEATAGAVGRTTDEAADGPAAEATDEPGAGPDGGPAAEPARSAARSEPSPATVRRLEAAAGHFASSIAAAMEERLPWYGALPADERSWVGLVAQAGFTDFIRWLSDPDPDLLAGTAVFGTAPRELTRTVTLQQTVELVRTAITVVEEGVDDVLRASADPALPAGAAGAAGSAGSAAGAPVDAAELVAVRQALLRYSREVAFAAAAVYARAAESRGAWDARLEALVVDAVLRGDGEEVIASRAAALGWTLDAATAVVIGASGDVAAAGVVPRVRRVARAAGGEALVGVQGERLVVVLSGVPDALATAARLAESEFGAGPVVVGPTVASLPVAARSARAALAGAVAARAWPEAPRPVLADDLLPERALSGDATARRALVDRAYRPLAAAGGALLETLTAYLASGGSLEACARELFVHANTVRYRLRRVGEVCGWTPTVPRERWVLQTAVALGRLAEPPAAAAPAPPPAAVPPAREEPRAAAVAAPARPAVTRGARSLTRRGGRPAADGPGL